jgi:glycerate dehydrogenase
MAPAPASIVVLDAHALNPGDLSWAPLIALGACQIHPRTLPAEVVQRAGHADVVLTNKTRLGQAELEAMPKLRYVGVLATGHDVVDVRAAAARGVTVSNVPAYGTDSVAQMTFALLLELCQHAGDHASAARAGRWQHSGEFAYWEHPLRELAGSTLGIIGLGRIGQAVARIGLAFGMHVIAAASEREDSGAVPPPHMPGVLSAPLASVFAHADVLTLHCPLNAKTTHMVDAERLASMKRTAFLINTARGGLIDEPALARALATGTIAGAALDVLSVEPAPPEHILLTAPNCIVTPHIAWATRGARERLLGIAIDNVRAFLAGAPQNVVNRTP